jgi:hypothetical protein
MTKSTFQPNKVPRPYKRREGSRPPGHPRFEPTDEQRATVQKMSSFGIPHREIALIVVNPETGRAIDDETLRSAFRRELDIGHVLANTDVVESLYNQAKSGNVTAQIWWTKTRLGWKEVTVQQFLDQDGNPVGPSLTLVGRPEAVPETPEISGTISGNTRH